jgi:signal transduction histidine kinase/ActR/RegA family two-component response regulator
MPAAFGQSIRYRLLVLITATVLAVVAVHDIAAYVELRRSAVALATERLDGVSQRLGDMLETQSRQIRLRALAMARTPAVRSSLQSPADPAARDEAASAMRAYTSPTVIAVELWDASGRRLAATAGGTPPATGEEIAAMAAAAAEPDSVAMSPMRPFQDSLVYATIARVRDGSATLGHVVEWRRVVTSVDGRRQLLELIGSDAAISVGNTRGEGWTDFASVIARPPVSLPATSLVSYSRPGVGTHLAATRPIAGTPWTLVVEAPAARVFAPVAGMLRRLALMTVVLLVLGLAAAWVLGTRLTTPLSRLAGAAAAISAGDYSRRLKATASDEVGELGRAFDHMADSIAAAHQTLEERSEELADRAGQLAEQATELEMSNEELAHSVDEALRTRDELAAATAELDASLASAPVGFAFHDDAGRYRRVNTYLSALDGVAVDAHVGRLPSEVVSGIGVELERHLTTVLARGDGVVNIELSGEVPGRPGVVQHWLASLYPIRTREGARLGVGSVITDLTSHKQLERQLLQAQKMEAVGRLAGGVAHDFNNILTAISGFGQFALADLDGPETADVRQDIEQVLAAAARAGALTRQLLAFSRQQVLQPQVLDLNAVVDGLSPMLGRLIGEDLRLAAKPAPGLSAVRADPNQVEQVLVNLVVNSRDAMPGGGSVVIETANVELDDAYAMMHEGVTPGSYVMLAVTDTGSGMDAATRARAFDPFFTTKEPGKGTGLGLSTVYGIVKQSGGSVEVYSEPARGTCIKVYLPRCEVAEAPRPATSNVTAAPNGRATVLLVDDDPHVAAAARRALERAGYMVLAASNGREGLRIAEIHGATLDLLVTDLVMPEMGGRDLARHIATLRPSVRVLFTSGYTAEAMNQQAVLEPGDAFLGKPFTPDGLLRSVHQVLNPAD